MRRLDLKRLFRQKDSFAYQALIAFSGYFFSFVIQLVLTPMIARLYTPDAYGTFAIINSVIMNLSLLLTFGYLDAFQLPKLQNDFYALVKASSLLVICCAMMVSVGVFFLEEPLSVWLGVGDKRYLLHVIGPAILMLGLFQIVGSWNIRDRRNTKNTRSSIVSTLISRGATIGYGYRFGSSYFGLILGDLLLKFFNLLLATNRTVLRAIKDVARIPFSHMLIILKTYKDYPRFVFPGNYVGLFSSQLPIFFFAKSATVTGFFSFGSSMLEIPMRLLGYSLGNVFAQKSAEAYRESPAYLQSVSVRLLKKLLTIGIPSFTLLVVFGDVLFDLVFGSVWRMAGIFSSVMSLYYILYLCTSTLNSIFFVTGNGRTYFRIQLTIFFFRGLVFILGFASAIPMGIVFLLYCLVNTMLYLVVLVIILLYLGVNPIKIMLQILAFTVTMVSIWSVLRWVVFKSEFLTAWREVFTLV
jgi:O-antigen/teichoic acid export membrane protein